MMWKVKVIAIPSSDFLAHKPISLYFRDALMSQQQLEPEKIQINIFSHMPQWVDWLMTSRNLIVGIFGFEVAVDSFAPNNENKPLEIGDPVGFMTVIHRDEHQIVSFSEDKHMEFYMSVSTFVNKKLGLVEYMSPQLFLFIG